VEKAIVPDYSLSSHVAPLGLAFYTADSLPQKYRGGAFVGEHGSWDRPRFNSYKVVFVPFSGGRPSGKTEDSLRDLRPRCKNRCAEGLDRGLGRQFH
jgi:hypothetical protein